MKIPLSIVIPLFDQRMFTEALIKQIKNIACIYDAEIIFSNWKNNDIYIPKELTSSGILVKLIYVKDAIEGESDAVTSGIFSATKKYITVLRYDEEIQLDACNYLLSKMEKDEIAACFTPWHSWNFISNSLSEDPLFDLQQKFFKKDSDTWSLVFFLLDSLAFLRCGIFNTRLLKQCTVANSSIDSSLFWICGLLKRGEIAFFNKDYSLIKQNNVDLELQLTLSPQRYNLKPYFFSKSDNILYSYLWLVSHTVNTTKNFPQNISPTIWFLMCYRIYSYYLHYVSQEAYFRGDYHIYTTLRQVFSSDLSCFFDKFKHLPKLEANYADKLAGELLANRFKLSIDLDYIVSIDVENTHPVIEELIRRIDGIKIEYAENVHDKNYLILVTSDTKKDKLIELGIKERKITSLDEIYTLHEEAFLDKVA